MTYGIRNGAENNFPKYGGNRKQCQKSESVIDWAQGSSCWRQQLSGFTGVFSKLICSSQSLNYQVQSMPVRTDKEIEKNQLALDAQIIPVEPVEIFWEVDLKFPTPPLTWVCVCVCNFLFTKIHKEKWLRTPESLYKLRSLKHQISNGVKRKWIKFSDSRLPRVAQGIWLSTSVVSASFRSHGWSPPGSSVHGIILGCHFLF